MDYFDCYDCYYSMDDDADYGEECPTDCEIYGCEFNYNGVCWYCGYAADWTLNES